jgi:hypothetical protein
MKTDRFLRDVIRHVSPSANRGGPPVWHAGPPLGMPPGSFEPVPGVVYVPCSPAGDHSDKRWQGLQRVTLGQPEHGDEDHDCDAMGCLQEHVVERVVLDPDVEWSREDEVATLVALRGSRSPFYVEITDLVRVYLHVDPQQPHDTPWTVNVGEGEGVTVARGAGGTLNEALAEARAWVSRLRVGLGAWSSSLVADRVRAVPALAHVDVDDDVSLLRAALVNAHLDEPRERSLWVTVRNLTGHGSGVGTAICRALGLDPDMPGEREDEVEEDEDEDGDE